MGGDFVGWLCMMFPMIRYYLLTRVEGGRGVFNFLIFFFFFCIGAHQRGKRLEV